MDRPRTHKERRGTRRRKLRNRNYRVISPRSNYGISTVVSMIRRTNQNQYISLLMDSSLTLRKGKTFTVQGGPMNYLLVESVVLR